MLGETYIPALWFSVPTAPMTQKWLPLDPVNTGILPEVFSGQGSICSLTPGRLQLVAMGLLGSAFAIEQVQHQGGPYWAAHPGQKDRIQWQ